MFFGLLGILVFVVAASGCTNTENVDNSTQAQEIKNSPSFKSAINDSVLYAYPYTGPNHTTKITKIYSKDHVDVQETVRWTFKGRQNEDVVQFTMIKENGIWKVANLTTISQSYG